jgi:hypothetical protein
VLVLWLENLWEKWQEMFEGSFRAPRAAPVKKQTLHGLYPVGDCDSQPYACHFQLSSNSQCAQGRKKSLNIPECNIHALGTPAPFQILQYFVMTPSFSKSRRSIWPSGFPDRGATSTASTHGNCASSDRILVTRMSADPHNVLHPYRIGSAPSSLFDRVSANNARLGRITWDR